MSNTQTVWEQEEVKMETSVNTKEHLFINFVCTNGKSSTCSCKRVGQKKDITIELKDSVKTKQQIFISFVCTNRKSICWCKKVSQKNRISQKLHDLNLTFVNLCK